MEKLTKNVENLGKNVGKIRPSVTKQEKEEIKGQLISILGSFIGTLLAFAWTTVVNELLNLIGNEYNLPEVALLTSFIYASLVTIIGLSILITGKRTLSYIVNLAVREKDEEEVIVENRGKDKDFE